MTWGDLVNTGANLSVLGALIFTWRAFLTELRRDRDFWREAALRGTHLAERYADAAESDAG